MMDLKTVENRLVFLKTRNAGGWVLKNKKFKIIKIIKSEKMRCKPYKIVGLFFSFIKFWYLKSVGSLIKLIG
jgi:hypothetical protein